MKKKVRKSLLKWSDRRLYKGHLQNGELRIFAFKDVLCNKCKYDSCKGWLLYRCPTCGCRDESRYRCACLSAPTKRERKKGCMYFEEKKQ